jgi:hypothetical protein
VPTAARLRALAPLAGALLLGALAPAAADGAVGLGAPTSYATFAGTQDVAVGDFDRDGVLDLASANSADDSFSVLVGRGDGTFDAAVRVALPSSPSTVSAADFDGDGRLDLAFADQGGDRVVVAWGAPSASGFDGTTTVVPLAGLGPADAVGADLDGDGRADLVVVNAADVSITTSLSGSGRVFAAPTTRPIGGPPVALAAGALFSPTARDVALAIGTGGAATMTGDGAGSLTDFAAYGTAGAPNGVAIADVTGDGQRDVVTSNGGGSGSVTLLAWSRPGWLGLQRNTALPAGVVPNGIATGDFTGDGRADAVVADPGAGTVTVLQDGGGSLPMTIVASYGAGATPIRPAAADFNGDGADDVAVASIDGAVRVLLSQGTPTVSGSAPASVAIGGALSNTVTLAGATPAAGGTLTFRLYGPDDAACAGAPLATATRTVTGNGDYSASFTADHAGTYRWSVAYSGDGSNSAAGSGCAAANQSTTVAQASPSVSVTASAPVTIGGAIAVDATVSGGHAPTGAITLSAWTTSDCSGSPAFVATLGVSGNGSYGSPLYTPAEAGTYRWSARYGGDADNAGASACGAPVAVAQARPSLSAAASAPATLPAGTLHDSVTLSGGHAPTGAVTFTLHGPGDATCTGTPLFADTVTVNGAGDYSSARFTPVAPGTYRWVASYGGDTNNEATASACGAARQTVDVAKSEQQIAFPPLADLPLGGGPVALGATASSGLAVTYASTTPAVCTVSGAVVSVHAVGTCSITASQPGDDAFLAAPDVTRSFAVTDDVAPALTLPGPIAVVADGATTPVTWSATAADAVDGSLPVTCDPPSGHAFPVGATTVRCSAADAAGNRATGTFTVSVSDRGAPALTLPRPIVLTAGRSGTAKPTWSATATDVVDGSVAVTCDRASGDAFRVGTTTVTCTATDTAGNRATGTFTVTVRPRLAVLGLSVDPRPLRLARNGTAAANVTLRLPRPAALTFRLQRRTARGWRTVATYRRHGAAGVNRAVVRVGPAVRRAAGAGANGAAGAGAAAAVLGTVRLTPGAHRLVVEARAEGEAPATATAALTVRAAQKVVFTG